MVVARRSPLLGLTIALTIIVAGARGADASSAGASYALLVFEKGSPDRRLIEALLAGFDDLESASTSVEVMRGAELQSRIGTTSTAAVTVCGADLSCIAGIGRRAGVGFVLFGRAAPTAAGISVQLLLVDVAKVAVQKKTEVKLGASDPLGRALVRIGTEILGLSEAEVAGAIAARASVAPAGQAATREGGDAGDAQSATAAAAAQPPSAPAATSQAGSPPPSPRPGPQAQPEADTKRDGSGTAPPAVASNQAAPSPPAPTGDGATISEPPSTAVSAPAENTGAELAKVDAAAAIATPGLVPPSRRGFFESRPAWSGAALAGAGAITVAAGAYFGRRSRGLRDDISYGPGGTTLAAALAAEARARRDAQRANLLFVAGGLLAGSGAALLGYWWYSANAEVTVGVSGPGAQACVAF